jgi:hypothetical protein
MLFKLGNNIVEVAKILKAHKFVSHGFSITPTTLAQTRSKLKSLTTGKQKVSQENASFPDDGKLVTGLIFLLLVNLKFNRSLAFR